MTKPTKLDTVSAIAPIVQWSQTEPTIGFMGRFWYQRNRRWITGTGAILEQSVSGVWEMNKVPLPWTKQIKGIIELFETILEKPKLLKLFISLLDSSEKDIFF